MGLSHKTIGSCLADNARQFPQKTAIIDENARYTWLELENFSTYMAYRMYNLGITRGTHVGLWSVNTPNWIIVYLALIKLGAVPVLINTCYQEQELVKLLNYADVEYLFYGENYKTIQYADVVESIREKGLCRVKKWISIGRGKDGSWLGEESFVKNEKTRKAMHLIRCLQQQSHVQDTAGMLFTSGTTSNPKGVLLSHFNLVNTAWATIRCMEWKHEDKICITVPLFHCFGLTSSMLTTILLGSTMCLLPYYRTISVLECVQTHRCTIINGVPSIFLAMMQNPQFHDYDSSSLRSGIIAGSVIYPKDYQKLAEEIPGLRLIPSYGQTETSPAVSFASYLDSVEKRAVSAGKIIPHIRVRIADPQSGKLLAAGQSGEIQVKGYNVMKGYYHLPEETKEVLDSSGWLRTGDLGYLDQEGYLYLSGRKKEMIIRAGENISPHEIEERILEIPGVEQAAVIGLPAEIIQEKVVACIIPKEGEHFSEEYAKQYLSKCIAHYKVPENFLLMESFPTTSSGKIQLSQLKMMAMEQLETGTSKNKGGE